MYYFISLKLFFSIIILSFLLKASAGQSGYESGDIPTLRRVLINNDSVIHFSGGSHDQLSEITLTSRYNHVIFELQPEDSTDYQYMLTGFDTDWSEWKHVNFKEYTNVPAGRYTFRVKYINKGTSGGETSIVSLRVLPKWYSTKLALVIYAISLVILVWVIYSILNLRFARKLYTLEQIINKRTEDLIIEKEKTEALLANVLPRNTASEIIEKGKATKIKYNFVTVLFSDIQGFTRIAEETNPEILIDELDKFFFHFDSVVEKFGIEKIKTIGDAYMCAGGIPEKNRTNPVCRGHTCRS